MDNAMSGKKARRGKHTVFISELAKTNLYRCEMT